MIGSPLFLLHECTRVCHSFADLFLSRRLHALRPTALGFVVAKNDDFSALLSKAKNDLAGCVQSVFILTLSPDPVSPLPLLTLSFSAKAHDISISSLYLIPDKATPASLVLPQVTTLTNGTTMPPPFPAATKDGGLTSILLTIYLPTPSNLSSNKPDFIDWVARENGEEVRVGYVCGMCMNVTKAVVKCCQVCGKEVTKVNE